MLLKPFQAQYVVIMHWKLATTSFTVQMDLKLRYKKSTSSSNQRNYSHTRWSLINGYTNSSGVLEVGLLNPPAVSTAGLFILKSWGRCFFSNSFLSRGLLLLRKTPTTGFAMQAAFLFFKSNRRCAFHTKHLIHRLTRKYIVARKPAFAVKWAGVFMFTPIGIFRWIDFDGTYQQFFLPDLQYLR